MNLVIIAPCYYGHIKQMSKTKEMKDIDRHIVQKDMSDYDKYLKAQNERKKW